jgi:hypothetical protein
MKIKIRKKIRMRIKRRIMMLWLHSRGAALNDYRFCVASNAIVAQAVVEICWA